MSLWQRGNSARRRVAIVGSIVGGVLALPAIGAWAQEGVEAEVTAVIEGFHAALAAGDSTRALRHLAEDAVILEAGGIETRDDYASAHLGRDMTLWAAVRIERGPFTVRVADDAAWAYSVLDVRGTVGERAVDFAAAELMVLTRATGIWKIRAIHWSTRQRAGSP